MRASVIMVALAVSSTAAAETAEEAFNEGSQLYAAGDYLAAAAKFERAHKLSPEPLYLFNIGQAYRFAKRCDRAAESFRAFLDKVPAGPSSDKVKEYLDDMGACTLVAEARALLDNKQFAAACGKLEAALEKQTTAATIETLGGCYEQLGKLATAVGWYRIAHTLAARTKQAGLEASTKRRVDELTPKVPTYSIEVPDGASVTLDGASIDLAALQRLELDPGAHRIEGRVGSRVSRLDIDAAIGAREQLVLFAGTTGNRRAYVLGGVGLSLLAGTAVLGLVARNQFDGADRATQERWKDTLRYGGTSMFVGGLVLVQVAVVLYVRSPRRPTERRAVVPVIAPDHVGIGLAAEF